MPAPPSFDNEKHGQEGAGIGVGVGDGGGKRLTRSVSRQKKKQDRVAANLERTGSGTGMSIADG